MRGLVIELSLGDLIMVGIIVLLATILAFFVVGAFVAGLGLGAVLTGGREALKLLVG